MDSTNQYDSLDDNDATFEDIPECEDTCIGEQLPSSKGLFAPVDLTFPKPFVGMEFDSLDKAYLFYNEYASIVGFSIRRAKNRRSNIDKELLFQRFCCSKEGHRRKRRESDDGTRVKDGVTVKVRRRNVRSIRVGCDAKLDVKRLTDGRWAVQKFDEEHNHEYADQGEKHLLRSQRRINSIRGQGDGMDVSIRSRRVMSYFTGVDGKSEEKRMVPEKGDAKAFLDYAAQMQIENPSFFYAVQAGKDDQMLNFFWADSRSRMDYGYFGDVIYVSTSYGANKYGRPFAPIVGINHHLQPVLFASAILLSETEDSFVWLLQTLLKAMHGHRPVTIITDQDEAMAKAIERVIPETHHRLCLWNIFQDAERQSGHLHGIRDGFSKDFKTCIYESNWCDEFDSRWACLLENYKLGDDEWLDNMYRKRHKWVPIYSRNIFYADMMTTQRVESINSFFNGYLSGPLSLCEFLKEYEKALTHRRQEEINEDIQSRETRPVLKLDVPMEVQAADIYTRSVFKAFHKEFCESFNYIAEETARVGTNWTYAVSRWERSRTCLVNLNSCDSSIRVICDCQNFEFTGILCKHIFKVFTVRNIMLVPEVYFMKRWTKMAKLGSVFSQRELQPDHQNSLAVRYNNLSHLSLNFCAKASMSINSYQIAKRNMEMILRELEKVSEEEDMSTVPESDIDHITNLHFPLDIGNNIGSSDHLLSEEDQPLSSADQVALHNAGVVDKRTGFWLRL